MYRTLVIIGIAATVAAVLGHLAVFGAKRLGPDSNNRTVRRFKLWEQLIHIVTLASFATLVLTGLVAVMKLQPLRGWLWVIHLAAAPVFAVGLCGLLATWARDCQFASWDWDWALKFGGYLGGDKHAPADRFNGGQKAYFWLIGVLGLASLVSGLGRLVPMFGPEGQNAFYQVHRYSALIFVLMAVVHLYLGTVANPGTLGAMITGKVSRQWAESHHPLWWKRIKNGNK